jgi:hypothetical protein
MSGFITVNHSKQSPHHQPARTLPWQGDHAVDSARAGSNPARGTPQNCASTTGALIIEATLPLP